MLEIISVYFEHCLEHNALCGRTARFVYDSGNAYSNPRALKGWFVLTTVDTNF